MTKKILSKLKPECIFCRIVSGQIPNFTVYEDNNFLAFLDIHPVVAGHVLVIPKDHYRWVHQVENFGSYWQVAQKIAQSQIKILSASTVIFATAGYQVPHAHIHVLPAPPRQNGQFLPGIESAKRIKVTSEQLKHTASLISSSLNP